ncbi:MAG: hypothetical protein GXP24_12570 [Planctomycetes bacterium]|nr:hypothetical protein [Planctomycetota bacterium]
MNAFTQLFSGMTQIYLNVAFIVCIFGILSFKPERINKVSLFKTGCLLFALSLIMPTIGTIFPVDAFDSTPRKMTNHSAAGMKISNLLSISIYAGAFFTTVLSLLSTTQDQKEIAERKAREKREQEAVEP